MRKLLTLTLLILLTSCGEEIIEKTEFIDKTVTIENVTEYSVAYSNFNVDCFAYKSFLSFKRKNSKLKMEVSTTKHETTLLNLGWKTFIKLVKTDDENNLVINEIIVGTVENADNISIQVTAENNTLTLLVDENEYLLDGDSLPENITFCHPDDKFIKTIKLLDRIEK
jgi:hypothetical protein